MSRFKQRDHRSFYPAKDFGFIPRVRPRVRDYSGLEDPNTHKHRPGAATEISPVSGVYFYDL